VAQEAELAAGFGRARVVAVDLDLAALGFGEAGDNTQQGGFPGAIAADQIGWPRKPSWRRVSVERGSLPWILILPRWALEKPATIRSRVVFPAPLRPIRSDGPGSRAGGGFRSSAGRCRGS